MKLKRVRSAVFSPCGGTWKATRAVVRGVPLEALEHDLTRPGDRPTALNFEADELVVFGFPVYAGRVPGGISETLFGLLTGRQTPAILVAVYGNREFEGAFLDLHKLAEGRGFRPVAAAAAVAEHSMAPDIAAGRPDDADRATLADFGRRIHGRLIAQPDVEAFSFEAPGAYPDRPLSPPLRPSADPELCTQCGQCVPACPAAVIPESDPRITGDGCLGCMACVKVCPFEARALRDPNLPAKMTWLRGVTGERKNPQFFF